MSWEPKFHHGNAVWLLAGRIQASVIEVDVEQNAYVVEVNGNPAFRLLCTDAELEADRMILSAGFAGDGQHSGKAKTIHQGPSEEPNVLRRSSGLEAHSR
jgi:hypothetical protein